MKKMKRLASLLLALVMTFAMASTVFATDSQPTPPEQKTITITNPVAGHTYTAYQIFSGEVNDDGQLTNLNWGSGISEAGKTALQNVLKEILGPNTPVATVAQIADALADIADDSENMDKVAQVLGDNKEGNGFVLTATEGSTSASATVDQGYYVVIDTASDNVANTTTISKYIVEVVGDVEIVTKAEETTSQKTVLEGDDAKKKFTEANIGEERTFYLTAKLPADYSAYTAFYMMFNDTMNHMDFVELKSVKVRRGVTADGNGTLDPKTGDEIATITPQTEEDVINGYILTASNDPADNEVTNADKNTLTIEIMDLKQVVEAAQAGDCVIVEYTAKLNSSAVINGANVNEFDLEFSNDPNDKTKPTPNGPKPPTGTTPPDQSELYTTEIELTKIDGATKDILTGAEFTLTGDTNNVVITTATEFVEKANGGYWKLKNDTYTTTAPTDETKDYYADDKEYAPEVQTSVVNSTSKTNIKAFVGKDGKVKFTGLGEGSYKLEETTVPDGYNKMADIEFEIIFNRETKTFSGSDGILKGLAANIENLSGSVLPSTGGIGTTIFYVVGTILVLGAGILLVTKRRMKAQ